MAYALQCVRLSKSYGDTPAVHELSLDVEEGQFVSLLGPSGCGKTTTLRLIAGFEEPDSGIVKINGEVVADARRFIPAEKRRVGMVFQDYALFPHVNVGGNIAFGLDGPGREKENRVGSLLELIELVDVAGRMPHELSGGQQQRVALARALAPQPAILLLDEPFSNLDTALRAQVRVEVRSILRQSGATAVFVTHDQEEALSLSDRVGIIFNGHLAQIDTPRNLYHQPVTKAVASFVGEANFLPAQATGESARCMLGETRLQWPARGNVELLIRPEALELGSEGAPAKIKWREFYGHDQRIGVVLGDGTQLVVRADSDAEYKREQNICVRVARPLLAFE